MKELFNDSWAFATMKIIEVNSKESRKKFLQIPLEIYKDNKYWIRPLDKDIESIFDPQKNDFHKHGTICRWILEDSSERLIGRVAAFIDGERAFGYEQPTGGIGYFECINDKEAAFTLLDKGRKWLEERKMEAMDGPVNFGSRDKFWGLLVEGFEEEPTYCINYNPPYYKDLFEQYGFKVYFEQYTYLKKILEPFHEKFEERAKRLFDNSKYSFRYIRKKNMKKYIDDFLHIYNSAWKTHHNFKPISREVVETNFRKLKPIIDERLVWFAYYEDEPVAMSVAIPEINQIIKHLNGKLDFIGKIKFYWHLKRKTSKKIYGLVFGIVPEHQKKGIEGGFVVNLKNVLYPTKRYDEFEFAFIGDFNPKMIAMYKALGANLYKKHVTYRKLFDDKKEFKRAPVIQY